MYNPVFLNRASFERSTSHAFGRSKPYVNCLRPLEDCLYLRQEFPAWFVLYQAGRFNPRLRCTLSGTRIDRYQHNTDEA